MSLDTSRLRTLDDYTDVILREFRAHNEPTEDGIEAAACLFDVLMPKAFVDAAYNGKYATEMHTITLVAVVSASVEELCSIEEIRARVTTIAEKYLKGDASVLDDYINLAQARSKTCATLGATREGHITYVTYLVEMCLADTPPLTRAYCLERIRKITPDDPTNPVLATDELAAKVYTIAGHNKIQHIFPKAFALTQDQIRAVYDHLIELDTMDAEENN